MIGQVIKVLSLFILQRFVLFLRHLEKSLERKILQGFVLHQQLILYTIIYDHSICFIEKYLGVEVNDNQKLFIKSFIVLRF